MMAEDIGPNAGFNLCCVEFEADAATTLFPTSLAVGCVEDAELGITAGFAVSLSLEETPPENGIESQALNQGVAKFQLKVSFWT